MAEYVGRRSRRLINRVKSAAWPALVAQIAKRASRRLALFSNRGISAKRGMAEIAAKAASGVYGRLIDQAFSARRFNKAERASRSRHEISRMASAVNGASAAVIASYHSRTR